MKVNAALVMGVSGSGKTTFGSALAARLGWAFADADDYHPVINRQKMARGEALSDTDRQPWLERLHDLLETHVKGGPPLVLACSALKASYRAVLIGNLEGVQVVFLHGDHELIAARMRQRQHFMPVSLLESQLQTLEPPTDALVLEIKEPLELMLNRAVVALQQAG